MSALSALQAVDYSPKVSLPFLILLSRSLFFSCLNILKLEKADNSKYQDYQANGKKSNSKSQWRKEKCTSFMAMVDYPCSPENCEKSNGEKKVNIHVNSSGC